MSSPLKCGLRHLYRLRVSNSCPNSYLSNDSNPIRPDPSSRKAIVGKAIVGGGLEVSLRWHAIRFRKFHLLLGPDAEALAVYGYGREATSAEASDLLAPAITVRLFAEIGLDLSELLSLYLTLGGGYNAMHVTYQAKNRDVSGLSGGYVSLATVLYFTLI